MFAPARTGGRSARNDRLLPCYRHQILDRIVIELLVEAWADGGCRTTKKDRVAIRFCLGHHFTPDIGGGTGDREKDVPRRIYV